MPASNAQLVRYKRQIATYRSRTSSLLIAAWEALPAYDEANIEQFVKRTAPALVGAKAAAVSLSSAFFALALGIRPVGISPKAIDLTADVQGPFRATWHALSMGRPFEEAVLVGRSTAQAVGFDFVQSVARRTGDHVAQASGREVRWKRVPGPGSCDWCKDMARHTWPTAEAADFGHERDDCDVVPV